MVALPDHMLYYDEQEPEWVRGEQNMPSYAVKRDANHGPIKKAIESFGVLVLDMWQCAQFVPGLLDLILIVPWMPTPCVIFVEIKDGLDKPLTPAEKRFIDKLRDVGAVCLVWHSLDEALTWLKVMRVGG